MPKARGQFDINEELYDQSKHLRSSNTNKRLRRLRAFERINYKKTCEIKKTGHNLDETHRLNDGNLRYATPNLTYSMNKKKRWLLPDIIEDRICENQPTKSTKGDKVALIDERLKIVMYENENIHYTSTCLRYGNNQTEPHVVYKNGRCFNSTTLTRWMNFDTRSSRTRHRRTENQDRVNQPNFGIQQRPGFFPSEVTYEFLYPRSVVPSGSRKGGKTSLTYCKSPRDNDWVGRHFKDTNSHRRTSRKAECSRVDRNEGEYDFEEEIDDRWSLVFEDSNDLSVSTGEFPIDYFIPLILSDTQYSSLSNNTPADEIYDHKAHKYFEPSAAPSESDTKKPVIINQSPLCSLLCHDESSFLTVMQQTRKSISQANLSPAIFIQRTVSSTFSVVYTYCRASTMVHATLKFTGLPPNILIQPNQITLETLIELVHKKLNQYETISNSKPVAKTRIDVDELRGSLPLPITLTKNMLLVQPHSTDKQTAVRLERIVDDFEQEDKPKQWFDTIQEDYEMLECSICCETLTTNDAYQLLPCRHTLCQECLTAFVRSSISSATYSSSSTSPLTCFQNNCSTQLNSNLLQAFVSYEIYESYRQSLIDRHLFSSGHYRQCPSRSCSDLLIVDDQTKPSLMCSCGQRVCATCLEEYHFPATCEQYKAYVLRLRESGDDLLSISKVGDNSSCYIAEGKNCPNCGEFVEKNGGCPHMTCKCGNEYCWMCLRRWASHNYSSCFTVPESTHELRSSTRNRLHNKAINHRRQRNQYAFNSLSSTVRQSKLCSVYHDILLSTYIDLNTMAEFIYVLLQRRRTDVNIRATLSRTARRLESDAFRLKIQVECEQLKLNDLENVRTRLRQTLANLVYMKRKNILI